MNVLTAYMLFAMLCASVKFLFHVMKMGGSYPRVQKTVVTSKGADVIAALVCIGFMAVQIYILQNYTK